jgi:hypothetical protein
MIRIPISVTNTFRVRIDNTEREISGTDMDHIEAAEIVALQTWPWLRNNLDDTRLVERAGDWLIYQLKYQQPDGEPNTARVAVRKIEVMQ